MTASRRKGRAPTQAGIMSPPGVGGSGELNGMDDAPSEPRRRGGPWTMPALGQVPALRPRPSAPGPRHGRGRERARAAKWARGLTGPSRDLHGVGPPRGARAGPAGSGRAPSPGAPGVTGPGTGLGGFGGFGGDQAGARVDAVHVQQPAGLAGKQPQVRARVEGSRGACGFHRSLQRISMRADATGVALQRLSGDHDSATWGSQDPSRSEFRSPAMIVMNPRFPGP